MRWHKGLYLTPYLNAHPSRAGRLIRRAKLRRFLNDGYVLSLKRRNGLIDIVYAPQLAKKHFPTRELYIIGVAEDYEAAAYLCADIVMDVYTRTGTFGLWQHFTKGSVREP